MNAIRITLVGLLALSPVIVGCQKRADDVHSDSATRTTTTERGSNVKLTDIDLGRSIDVDNSIKDKTQSFKPNDTIYASIDTKGASPGTPIVAEFRYQDGQVVHRDNVTIAPEGKARTEFHINKPDGFPAGEYVVEIRVGDTEPKSQKLKVTE